MRRRAHVRRDVRRRAHVRRRDVAASAAVVSARTAARSGAGLVVALTTDHGPDERQHDQEPPHCGSDGAGRPRRGGGWSPCPPRFPPLWSPLPLLHEYGAQITTGESLNGPGLNDDRQSPLERSQRRDLLPHPPDWQSPSLP